MARDNTVKYQLHILQLLQVQDRPNYAGVKVEVLERSDGQLMVQHDGKVISHQEAPPKAGALRATQGALAPTTELGQVVRNLSQHGLTKPQLQLLAALRAPVDGQLDDEHGSSSYTPPPRQATAGLVEGCPPRQTAGCLSAWHRQVTRHLQKHRQEVHRVDCLAHKPDSHTDHPISTQNHTNGHFP